MKYANLEEYVFGNGLYDGIACITGCAGCEVIKGMDWAEFVTTVFEYLLAEDREDVKHIWDELVTKTGYAKGHYDLKRVYDRYLAETA